jgi:tetratricopeptide (TPR) repeat protein
LADLSDFLQRGWTGITEAVRPRTAAALFRRADRCRNQGRYDEAARLVAQGLELAPDSSVGHLLSGYLHAAAREMDRGKTSFQRVLGVDPYHPRALLGLARIAIEEQDLDGAKALLDRALQFYSDFPEAQALRDLLASWATQPAPAGEAAETALGDFEMVAGTQDLVVTRGDGSLAFTKADAERSRCLTQHVNQVSRMASAILSRAGFGALRRAAIETGSEMTFLLSDTDTVLAATVEGHVDLGSGFAQIGRIWGKLTVKA